jgi:probable F420-dependent oxidoreductase
MVGTLAPFCDENLSFGAPLGMTDPRDSVYALGFQCKVNTPGLKWICRDKLDYERPHYDNPLVSRFEEMDAIAVWENAFVPWSDVFIAHDLDAHNNSLPGMKFMPSLGHHVIVKNVAKTRFLFGLAHLLAESAQISNFINVQERLGDILMWLNTMESLAIAAVEGAELNPANNLYYCNEGAINAALRLYPEVYPRIIDHLMQLGGGGYISIPQEATLEVADLAIDKYYKGTTSGAKDKVALFRLAWDIVGTSWGGRQELYERFFFGDSQRMKSLGYQFYDKADATRMVARILQPPQGPKRGPMKLGAAFSNTTVGTDWGAIKDVAVALDEAGFDSIATNDHVIGGHPDRAPGEKVHTFDVAVHEPIVLLSFIAAVTTRVELVTSILLLPQRQTTLVAKQVAELDLLSGGRVRLGVGVGRNWMEYEALNEDFTNRGVRMEEQIEVLRRYWTEELVTFDGRWHHLDRVGLNPGPIQRPVPIWMGSFFGSIHEPVIERIGRMADGWMPQFPPDKLAPVLERVRGYAAAAGRNPDDLGIECGIRAQRSDDPQSWVDLALAYRDLGATHLKVMTGADCTTPTEHIELMTAWHRGVSAALA